VTYLYKVEMASTKITKIQITAIGLVREFLVATNIYIRILLYLDETIRK